MRCMAARALCRWRANALATFWIALQADRSVAAVFSSLEGRVWGDEGAKANGSAAAEQLRDTNRKDKPPSKSTNKKGLPDVWQAFNVVSDALTCSSFEHLVAGVGFVTRRHVWLHPEKCRLAGRRAVRVRQRPYSSADAPLPRGFVRTAPPWLKKSRLACTV